MSTTQTIHKHLIVQSQKGDQAAMSELYNHYAVAMYNICRRMMTDDEEARDMLQEAFVEAFQKIATLREISTFSAWIKRIVVNKCINAIRKKKLDMTQFQEGADYAVEEEEDFEYTHYRSAQIMSAIDLLPEGCRMVLNLYLFEGYDHKEIGEILRITESASKAQYSKAKSRIRMLLAEERRQYVG